MAVLPSGYATVPVTTRMANWKHSMGLTYRFMLSRLVYHLLSLTVISHYKVIAI